MVDVFELRVKTYQQKWENVVKCGKIFNIFDSLTLMWEVNSIEFIYRNIRVQSRRQGKVDDTRCFKETVVSSFERWLCS